MNGGRGHSTVSQRKSKDPEWYGISFKNAAHSMLGRNKDDQECQMIKRGWEEWGEIKYRNLPRWSLGEQTGPSGLRFMSEALITGPYYVPIQILRGKEGSWFLLLFLQLSF